MDCITVSSVILSGHWTQNTFKTMETEVRIRPVILTDLSDIMRIENMSFNFDSFSHRQFTYLITKAKGAFFTALSEEKVAGYISLLEHSRRHSVRIYGIAVHPDYRGRKIGQALIDEAKQYTVNKNIHRLSLEVEINNKAAITLYQKNGFLITGILSNYYCNHSDAYRMILNLAP
jgi:ribosomal-protein-alanine acetyltransferase